MQMHLPVAGTVIRHPAVVSYFHERDVDVRDVPFFSFDFVQNDSLTEVVSEDPYRVRVTVDPDDDAPTLTLDEEMTVVSVE